jgi:putative endopeptidase
MTPIRLLCASSLLLCAPLSAQDLRGLDPANLDPAVAACSDFYRHANGGWLRRTPVPAGHGSHGLFEEMREAHRQQRLRLLAEIAADPARQGQPLADFIAGGLDEAAIEAASRRELDALLAPTAAIDPPPKRLPALIATLHTRGLPLLFRAEVAQAEDGPHLRLLAGGLGLPDRDYYLREDAPARALLGHYRGYVERLLTLAGSSDPANDAAWVLDAEVRLARGWPAPGSSAPALTASVRDLQRRYPAIDWRGWLAANGLARQPRLTLADPAYFDELNRMIASGQPAQWRAYLRFHIAHLLAPFLGHEFVAVHDDFFQRTLRGRSAMPTRAERVLEVTERVLGPAFEQAVVERQLPPATRAAVEQQVADLRAILREGLAGAAWLPETARAAAVERLDQLSVEIALPGAGVAPGALRFDRSRHADNVLRAAAQLHRERLARLQQRGSTRDAETTPLMAAQYDPRSNKLQLGIGVLAPPLFDPAGDPALSYGSLGALVGHELLHGFDLAGAAWAGETPDAARIAAYESHTAPLRVQYAGYRSIGDRPVDGHRTLAENAADLAGLELAWRAWQQRHGAIAPADAGAQAPAQRFFLGWAQMWRRNYRDEDLIRRLRQDPHPPAPFRVNGPLPHLDGFAAAFGCSSADPLYLAPEARLRMFR